MNNTTNSSQPLVTVAMVTYNSEKYVRTAIESVLASSYTNFELIISDDCSTDKTWEIINEYKDARIRKYQNPKNIREYPNRNGCIDLAKGEYLIFVDGDDYIYPHALEHFITGAGFMPSAAMIISRPESDHMIYPVILTPEESFKYDYLGKSVTSQGFPSTLFKLDILKKHKLPCSYISGDTFIKKVLAYNYPLILIYDGLIWWRKTPGQASERLFNSITGLLENFKINYLFLKQFNSFLSSKEKKKALNQINKPLIRQYIKAILYFRLKRLFLLLKEAPINIHLISSVFYKNSNEYKIASSVNPAYFEKR